MSFLRLCQVNSRDEHKTHIFIANLELLQKSILGYPPRLSWAKVQILFVANKNSEKQIIKSSLYVCTISNNFKDLNYHNCIYFVKKKGRNSFYEYCILYKSCAFKATFLHKINSYRNIKCDENALLENTHLSM